MKSSPPAAPENPPDILSFVVGPWTGTVQEHASERIPKPLDDGASYQTRAETPGPFLIQILTTPIKR
jgi:hypothetical protein